MQCRTSFPEIWPRTIFTSLYCVVSVRSSCLHLSSSPYLLRVLQLHLSLLLCRLATCLFFCSPLCQMVFCHFQQRKDRSDAESKMKLKALRNRWVSLGR